MQPLASITTLSAVGQYAAAEMAVAATKCPVVVAAYQAAIDIANAGATTIANNPGTDETGFVDGVKAQIAVARKAWYANGCASPTTGAAAASTTEDAIVVDIQSLTESAGGGGASTGGISWLWIGLLVAGAFILGPKLFKSSPAKAKPKKRKATKRRR